MRTADEGLKIRRREQILNTAAELFAAKSYHEVLMEEVADQTGLSKGSVYNYFCNKEELYFSIIIQKLENLLWLIKERVDHKQTPLINIRRIIIHTYSFMAKYPHFFQIWYKEKLNCRQCVYPRIHELYQQIRMILTTALEKGKNEKLLRDHPVEFISDIILGIVDSAVLRSADFSTEEKRLEARRVFEFVLDALGTPLAHEIHLAGEDEPENREEIPGVIAG